MVENRMVRKGGGLLRKDLLIIEDFLMRQIKVFNRIFNHCWCYAGKICFSIYISLLIYNQY